MLHGQMQYWAEKQLIAIISCKYQFKRKINELIYSTLYLGTKPIAVGKK